MISGTFGRPALPYIPGFEVAGVVETVGDGVNVRPGERVWASLGVAGGDLPSMRWQTWTIWHVCPSG
jgi:NADPH:quinone reductase-like Zn-dependent oxidoreductase